MRKVEIDVYTLSELPERARERAHRDWAEERQGYDFHQEACAVLEAFEKEFGVRFRDWQLSELDYSFRLDTGGIDDAVLALKGNRARAWFWNNHGDVLLTGRYYPRFHGTKRAHSRFFFDRVYDGTCPWTGCFMDCAALDPIAHFCFGVEPDGEGGRRVPSSRRLADDDRNTVESLLNDSAHSLFEALRDDCEYRDSMEAFMEECRSGGYEFTRDGEMWSGE